MPQWVTYLKYSSRKDEEFQFVKTTKAFHVNKDNLHSNLLLFVIFFHFSI